MKHPIVAPSLLAADFGNLQAAVEMVEKSQAGWHHLDIMDGVFVPNISYGMPVVKAISKHAKKPLDAHLMIVDPDRYISDFAALGVANLTVHYEACTHLHRTLQAIRKADMKAGVALNPHTPVGVLESVLGEIDIVCIMSVNPGFGGQSFIPEAIDKVRKLSGMIRERQLDTLIEVDGGVNHKNAPVLLEAGADVLVAGSLIFSSDNPSESIARLAAL